VRTDGVEYKIVTTENISGKENLQKERKKGDDHILYLFLRTRIARRPYVGKPNGIEYGRGAD